MMHVSKKILKRLTLMPTAVAILFTNFVLLFGMSWTVAQSAGIVPCGDIGEDQCRFNDIVYLIQNIMEFVILYLIIPAAAITFMYAGFLYLTSLGDTTKVTKAKTAMLNLVYGIIIVLGAWLAVATILTFLGVDGAYSLLDGV